MSIREKLVAAYILFLLACLALALVKAYVPQGWVWSLFHREQPPELPTASMFARRPEPDTRPATEKHAFSLGREILLDLKMRDHFITEAAKAWGRPNALQIDAKPTLRQAKRAKAFIDRVAKDCNTGDAKALRKAFKDTPEGRKLLEKARKRAYRTRKRGKNTPR
jgi:hypothetical protein